MSSLPLQAAATFASLRMVYQMSLMPALPVGTVAYPEDELGLQQGNWYAAV